MNVNDSIIASMPIINVLFPYDKVVKCQNNLKYLQSIYYA